MKTNNFILTTLVTYNPLWTILHYNVINILFDCPSPKWTCLYIYNFAQILYAVVKTHNLILICPLYFFTNCFVLAVTNSIWHSLCGSIIFVADVSSISVSYILLNTFWINTPIVNESCVHFWNVTCRCTQFPIPNISYNNPSVDYFYLNFSAQISTCSSWSPLCVYFSRLFCSCLFRYTSCWWTLCRLQTATFCQHNFIYSITYNNTPSHLHIILYITSSFMTPHTLLEKCVCSYFIDTCYYITVCA